ncbi:galectin-3 isoform X2 [Hyla sarda]|nr:galectin-3 isoform X2 [Hyla sarda]XP_056400914.1 galectin-3 isoform X2 [Hyla sarda]XP_056400916.1 galectin-3 isoform X2 [Hyla sarda]
MSEFSLDDALSGQGNAGNLRSDQQGNPGQNWNNPWGGQNPGAQGFPGQPYPGNPAPGQGQQLPGYPAPGQGPQYPGYPAPGQGTQYPGYPAPVQGQQYPGFPPGGQQYPGVPPAGGQQYPGGYPGFPGPGQSYPGAPTPGQGTTDPKQSVPSVPSGPQRVPCTIPLPGGCVKGMCLEIEGIPNGKRFSIDYKVGNDIALHVNPRFDEHPNVIVRNSFIGGKWGNEERQCPKFPFQQGKPFKLQVLFQPDCYKVAVNNENLCQFKHRITNFSGINCIHVDGALTISGARITMV